MTRQDSLVGQTIAGYRLLEDVGEGGTAAVYRAEHPERGPAAIKILRPRLAQDPVAVKRFLREAEFGVRIDHPNIVHTYDYGELDGRYYLALEWASGEPLATFAARTGRLAPLLVARIIEQLGAALSAAHAQGIIHRDLKPANVMYDPATQGVKLLDFGIARDADLKPEDRLTRTGFFVGTLQYVAPESLSGELVTEQADVYSLATITYYLLSGALPYTGRSPRELFQQLLSEPPEPLNQAMKGRKLPAAIEAAVMRGLERDRTRRSRGIPEFVSEFCEAVRRSEGPKTGLFSKLFQKSGPRGDG
jgi:eukaryotic-like serine/threonine-protein kinase